MKTLRENGYGCDGRRIHKVGCANPQRTGGDPGTYSWCCLDCDFDLCPACVEKYWDSDAVFVPQKTKSAFSNDILDPCQIPNSGFCAFRENGLAC